MPPTTTPPNDPAPRSARGGGWLRRENIPNLLTVGRLVLAATLFCVLGPWHFDQSTLAAGGVPDVWLLVAALIFTAAAATDALDGYLARRWNAVSVFGRIMDPFADKLLVIGAFVFLAGPGFWWGEAPAGFAWTEGDGPGGRELLWRFHGVQVSGVYPWMVVVILGRELLVTSIRGVVEGQGIAFPATASGKWKMILQSITIPSVLVMIALGGGHGMLGGAYAPSGDIPSAVRGGLTIAIQVLVWATVLVTVWSGVPYVIRALRVLAPPSPPATTPPGPPPGSPPAAPPGGAHV